MKVLQREFYRNLKALIIWVVIISGLMILTIGMFPEVAKQQEAIEQIMKGMPEGFIKAFGMDKINMSDALGYYATKGYVILTLFGSIYSVMLTGNILSKEHNEKTIEFLLSKPISRSQIVSQKLLSVFVNLVIFNLIINVTIYTTFKAVNADLDFKVFALMSFAPFMLHLVFSSISFLLSSIMKKSRSIISISLGIIFIMYFLSIVSSISDKYENIKYITPFEYVNPITIVLNKSLDTTYIIIMFGIILLSVAASYIIYQKKDITV